MLVLHPLPYRFQGISHFLWSWKTGGQAPNPYSSWGKEAPWFGHSCPSRSLQGQAQTGNPGSQRGFSWTPLWHFKSTFQDRCWLNQPIYSMSFIPPKALGVITKPDKVAEWGFWCQIIDEREAKPQTPCRISSGAGNNAQARTLVAFVFLSPLCIPLPFPLNDLVMFVPSHCVQTLQIKIASHLKKILSPLFFKGAK